MAYTHFHLLSTYNALYVMLWRARRCRFYVPTPPNLTQDESKTFKAKKLMKIQIKVRRVLLQVVITERRSRRRYRSRHRTLHRRGSLHWSIPASFLTTSLSN